MKYLHLINDEKFTDFVIRQFEQCNPGRNTFLIGIERRNRPLRYTKSISKVKVRLIGSKEYNACIANENFDVLVIHCLDYYKKKVVAALNKKVAIVWLAWGIDIYDTPFYNRSLYQPLTTAVLQKLDRALAVQFKQLLRKLYYMLPFFESPEAVYKKAVSKVHYCATVVPGEIDILKSWDFYHARTTTFSYASIEDDFDGVEINDKAVPSGKNVLIGNSVAPSSNHLDAFQKLVALEIKDMDIIVPLNYGIDLAYRDIVIHEGERIFGERFKPLLSFLPKKDYIEMLSGCRAAIMNHERQQGLGNILILLWLGIKIFLSENNLIYPYLKDMGIHIYSFQNDLTVEQIEEPLLPEFIEENRKILYREYGHVAVLNKTENLINTIAKMEYV